MKILKIPLENFIEILNALYESGADYIDMEYKEDVINITVPPEYLMPGAGDSIIKPEIIKLTKKDLMDLI